MTIKASDTKSTFLRFIIPLKVNCKIWKNTICLIDKEIYNAEKCLKQNEEIKQNWTGLENFDSNFC